MQELLRTNGWLEKNKSNNFEMFDNELDLETPSSRQNSPLRSGAVFQVGELSFKINHKLICFHLFHIYKQATAADHCLGKIQFL